MKPIYFAVPGPHMKKRNPDVTYVKLDGSPNCTLHQCHKKFMPVYNIVEKEGKFYENHCCKCTECGQRENDAHSKKRLYESFKRQWQPEQIDTLKQKLETAIKDREKNGS